MPGAIAIILLILLIPIAVLMTGAFIAGLIGELLYRDGRARYEGSELLDLPD